MEFLLIAVAHFLALLSPGPDFFLILQAAVRLPLRYCLAICFGIALANGVYLFFAVFGLEMVKETVWLVALLKYLGAAYLLFLGVMLLTTQRQSLKRSNDASFLEVQSLKRQFSLGFLSAILNPKNAIFYLSLFTVMVSTETELTLRCLYALWMMSVVLLWDCCLVLVLAGDRIKKMLGTSIYFIEKVSGLALAGFGIILPFF